MGLNILQFPLTECEATAYELGDVVAANQQGPPQATNFLARETLNELTMQIPLDIQHLRIAEEQNYKLALIPPQHLTNQSEPDAPGQSRTDPVFVLPLTWKDLVRHLGVGVLNPQSNQSRDVYSFGAVQVNFASMEVHRAGKPVKLTSLEFKVLRYLISRAMQVVSRDELLSRVWGFDHYPCTRTVDTLVCRLRRKLEPDRATPMHFLSVHAVGYKFTP